MFIQRIDAKTLDQQLESDEPPLVIDARGTDRWTQSGVTLDGAVRIPPNELRAYMGRIPRSVKLVIYCDRPRELLSTRVAITLLKNGYENVSVLKGGFTSAIRARLPIISKMVNKDVTAKPPTASSIS